MSQIQPPVLEVKKIIKATVIALVVGAIILVIAVLPAEYGIDPTGLGKSLGFNQLYQPEESSSPDITVQAGTQPTFKLLKMADGGSDPNVPVPNEANNPAPEKQLEEREDSVIVNLAAGKGIEYKIDMLKYGKIKYEWFTNEGTLFVDFHGEVKQKNPPKDEYYDSYTVAYSNNMVGSFMAPFEGKHGWYFKNRTPKDVQIKIRIKGQYALRNDKKS